jgi:release factor glutamine methyltransferase
MNTEKQWKVLDLINTTTQYFSEKEIENPRLNAEQLLGHTLNLSRVQLYVSFERPLTNDELTGFREKVRRRANREPLQYILGEMEFMGLPVKVTPDVLIPRPETEILVEEVLTFKEIIQSANPLILDIGTGSGCIAIALAKMWPEARLVALEQSKAALDVTEENCALNELESFRLDHNTSAEQLLPGSVHLLHHDILSGLPANLNSAFDVVVSNPPYIAKQEMAGLQPEVKDFEPWPALTDNADGLQFYKQIFGLTKEQRELKTNYLCLEMSGSQPEKIVSLASEFSFASVEVKNDLNQIPRVLKIKVNP